jgi:hypothetical protein
MKKAYIFLFLVLTLCFILRTFPYLSGYENPILGDSVREYQLINYIENNGIINFEHIYGLYPDLHIVISTVALLTGLNSMVLLFYLPAGLFAISLLLVFLLLNKLFNKKIAIVSVFVLATSAPLVWWCMKPVRETIGLFFFILLVYLFFKLNDNKLYLIPLLLASIAGLFSHHWSMAMLLIFMLSFILFTRNKTILYTYLIFFFAVVTYFYFSLNSVKLFFGSDVVFFILLIISVIGIFFLNLKLSKAEINFNYLLKILDKYYKYVIFLCLILLVLIGIMFRNSFVYEYDFFFACSVFFPLVFAVIGFPIFLKENTKVGLLLFFSLILFVEILLFGIITNYLFYDSGRVVEFIIFPTLLFVAEGILFVIDSIKYRKMAVFIGLLVFISLFFACFFIIPEVYLGSEPHTLRSYLQYIPVQGNIALKWAAENNALIMTDNTYVLALFELYSHSETNSYLGYISDYDVSSSGYDSINVAKIGSKIEAGHILYIQQNDKVYTNDWADFYSLSKDEYYSLYNSNPYNWFWGGKEI